MSLSDNDDDEDAPTAGLSIAEGQIPLILAESVLHLLVERKVLTVEDAIAAVRTAAEVRLEMGAERGESPERAREALDSLIRILSSFACDLDPVAQRQAKADWDRNLGSK